MKRPLRLLQLVCVNAVPLLAITYRGWSDSTVLALYWCETLMLVLLVAVRLDVHRRLTGKRGHFVEKRLATGTIGKTKKGGVGYFVTNFFWFSLGFSLFNAIFLLGSIDRELMDKIDVAQVKQGVLVTGILLVIGLVMDLVGIRERPFAWIRAMSVSVLSRVFLVQAAFILGVIGMKTLDLPRSTFFAFVGLKILTDITSQIPSLKPPPTEEEQERAAAEEQPFRGKPIPFEQALIQRIDG